MEWNRRFTRRILGWALVVATLVALSGTGWTYGGGGGGGGGAGGDGSSPFIGVTPQELVDIFAHGYRAPVAGGTVDIGGGPASTGMDPEIPWNPLGQIPSGFPKLTPRQIAEIDQAFNEALAKGYLTEASKADLGLKIARIIGLGAAVGAGIVSGVAPAAVAGKVAAIGIAGDGLAAGAGAFTESVTQGKSATDALQNGMKAGLSKAAVSTLTSKIQSGSDAANAALGTAIGIGYDEVGNAAPNSAPPPPVVAAPMSMPQIVSPIVHPNM